MLIFTGAAQPLTASHATTLSVRTKSAPLVVTLVEIAPVHEAFTNQMVVGLDAVCGA